MFVLALALAVRMAEHVCMPPLSSTPTPSCCAIVATPNGLVLDRWLLHQERWPAHRPSLLTSGISKLHALNETKKSKVIQTTLPRLIGKKFNLRIKR